MGLTYSTLESLTKTVTQHTSFATSAPVWMSLHVSNPGPTGAYEVTSGTGAAGRQVLAFTGSGGTDALVAPVSFTLSFSTVTWIGYWTTQTGGTFLGGFPLVGAGKIAAAIAGTTSIVAPDHGLSVDMAVRMFPIVGSVASNTVAGLTTDTRYFVVSTPDLNHVTFSASLGGSPITPSQSGAFGVYRDEGEYSVGGILTFPASTGLRYVTIS